MGLRVLHANSSIVKRGMYDLYACRKAKCFRHVVQYRSQVPYTCQDDFTREFCDITASALRPPCQLESITSPHGATLHDVFPMYLEQGTALKDRSAKGVHGHLRIEVHGYGLFGQSLVLGAVRYALLLGRTCIMQKRCLICKVQVPRHTQ